jgi:hypothetical protein
MDYFTCSLLQQSTTTFDPFGIFVLIFLVSDILLQSSRQAAVLAPDAKFHEMVRNKPSPFKEVGGPEVTPGRSCQTNKFPASPFGAAYSETK